MKKRRWKKMTALSLLFIFFSSNHIPAEPLPQDNPDETQEENEIEIEEPWMRIQGVFCLEKKRMCAGQMPVRQRL